jgi:hypothetical protein
MRACTSFEAANVVLTKPLTVCMAVKSWAKLVRWSGMKAARGHRRGKLPQASDGMSSFDLHPMGGSIAFPVWTSCDIH